MSAVTTSVERPPVVPRPLTWTRIAGYVAMAFWVLAGIGMLAFLVTAWNPELFDRWAMPYLKGLGVTMLLVSVSIVIGALLSLPIAYGRMSKNRVANAVTYAYVYFFRGTPLLAQTFLVYYGAGSFRLELESVGLWWLFRDEWYCAIIAFSLNTAAYQAEILRGAIQSVPKGQWEGAASLGLHRLQTLRKIILPQAMIVALRPYGNEIILMIKGSAIVALITVLDLMGTTRLAYSRSFDFQTYIWAGIIYLAIVELLRNIVERIERRLTRHLVR
ncbi:MAG: ABC transporter permease [Rhizobiaceae bacterium]